MPLSDPTIAAVTGALAELPVTAESQTLSHGTTLLTMSLRLETQPSRLWGFLTEPELLATWSPIVPDRVLAVVGPAWSRETPEADPVEARVIEIEPLTVLRHAWDEGEVLWELVEEGEASTRLTLTQTFDQQEYVPMTAAGWHVCLTVLSLVLAGRDVERVVGEDAMAVGWEALRAAYAKNFDAQS